MRKMKDSGVAWLGEIPENWNVTISKAVFENVSERNHPDATVLSLYRDLGVVPKDSRDDNHNVTSENTAQYKFVECGNLVINKMKAWQGSLAVSNYDGIVSPAYYVCRFRNKIMNKEYVHYLLRSNLYAQQFERLSTGMRVGQWDLSIDDFLSTQLLVPPKNEQIAIAECLDCKTSQVDTLIANVQEQIEKLKAYKQSLITEVVTKGLDPTVPMKDSGVEWIGEIPKEWSAVKAKYCVEITHGRDPKTEGNIPVYGSGAESFKSCGEYKEGPTVLIGRKGATLHIPHYIEGKYWNVDTAFDVKPKNNFFLRYYYYLATSFDYKFYISQTTLPGMTQSNYYNMLLPFPTLPEQQEIADYLDAKCSEIDKLISIKQSKIEKLEQYKRSLIYEYVTGKKEVP